MKLDFDKMAKYIAEATLDEFLYKGKTIRQWADIIKSEDLAPVVHAKYGFVGPDLSVYRYDTRLGTCSSCKERILFRNEHSKYCPNCGAKMDGDAHGQQAVED